MKFNKQYALGFGLTVLGLVGIVLFRGRSNHLFNIYYKETNHY